MHKVVTGLVCLSVAILPSLSAAENGVVPENMRAAVDAAVAKVKPSLVRIHVVSTRYWDGREQKYESSGSGVVITTEGHVITNHHVAGHATRLVCTLSNKEEIEAELIGSDAPTDISIIKLKPTDGRTFDPIEFGDSSAVQVGEYVLAMGSPLALSQSVTMGIVSNAEMVMPERQFGRLEQDGENVGALVRWIGHDAQIFPGNSGGPLVNLEGKIVGINEIGIGLGGAIPGNLAKDVAFRIIDEGSVVRSWLGISVRPLLKYGPTETGVLVSDTLKGGPAEKAGIQSGDILLSFAGEDITVRFEEQLPLFNQLVAALPVGGPYEAKVMRDGAVKTLEVTTQEREEALPKERELKQWGLTVRNLSYMLARELKRDNQEGVMVTSVGPGGPSGEAKPAIAANDVIVEVNGKPITSVEDLVSLTDELTLGATEPVSTLTTYERQSASFVTVVKVGIKELRDPGLEVKKAWLPVQTQVITRDIAAQLEKPELTGFRITSVYKDTSAEIAGLKVGDMILAVDGQQLTASALEHYEELPTLIRNYRPDTTIELSVLRNGAEMTVSGRINSRSNARSGNEEVS